MSTLFVSRGRSVSIDGKAYAPGATVTLATGEAEFLTERGFLQDTPPNLAPAVPETNPANIGRQFAADVQWPRYK